MVAFAARRRRGTGASSRHTSINIMIAHEAVPHTLSYSQRVNTFNLRTWEMIRDSITSANRPQVPSAWRVGMLGGVAEASPSATPDAGWREHDRGGRSAPGET